MKNLKLSPQYYELPKDTGKALLLHYYEGEPDFLFHYHPEFELVLVRGSSGRRLIGDQTTNYSGVDLVLLGPNLPHTWASEPTGMDLGKMHNTVVHFTRESLGIHFLNKPEMSAVNAMLKEAALGISFDAAGIAKVAHLLDLITETEGLSQFITLLRVLKHLSLSEGKTIISDAYNYKSIEREHDAFSKVLTYIHEKSGDKIVLEDVSRLVGMSIPTFTRFFKRMTGSSFVNYIIEWRIQRACIFLKETNLQVIDICHRAGFNNLSHFNRQFRKKMGMTPREYRRDAHSSAGEKNLAPC